MMPAIFIGHGNPMNALAQNSFAQMLRGLGSKIPRPRAILCISAHWMSEGTWVTSMDHPKTIHDFYGFPQKLFEVQYPAPGDKTLAEQIKNKIPDIHLDFEMWGLDHGCWSVLKHLYPEANIPVLQLSLYLSKPMNYHFELGKQLSWLRNEGVLIVGSGNIVHNLSHIKWEEKVAPYEWVIEFDEWVKSRILARDFESLINESNLQKLSVPTLEHYLPLLYILGASSYEDKLQFVFEEIHNASISMRSFAYGLPE